MTKASTSNTTTKEKTKKISKSIRKVKNSLATEIKTKLQKESELPIDDALAHKIIDIAINNQSTPASAITTVKERRWNVKPEQEEGVWVPDHMLKTINLYDGKVKYTDHVIGSGSIPKPGSKVKITYEGYTSSGVKFAIDLKRKKPFQFRLGLGQVTKGLDEGMDGMRVGGSRVILISPEFG